MLILGRESWSTEGGCQGKRLNLRKGRKDRLECFSWNISFTCYDLFYTIKNMHPINGLF